MLGVGKVFHHHGFSVRAEEGPGTGNGRLAVDEHPRQVRTVVIPQAALQEVVIPIQQHRGLSVLGRLLDGLPLLDEYVEIFDELFLAHSGSFRTHQQTCSRWLDENGQGPQAVALRLAADAAGKVDALNAGLQHQKAARQRDVAGETRPLRTGGLFHHLHQHLLAWLQKLGDRSCPLLQAQRTQVGDVNEAVFLAFADVHKCGIDTGMHVLNGTEIDVANLMLTLGDDQLIDALVAENGCDAQLLSDKDLLGHEGKPVVTGNWVSKPREIRGGKKFWWELFSWQRSQSSL